ncbi:xanthine dehydrogenase accessory protein XdhC [Thalassospira indica]|uniref:Xanthine dehydrogenase accessory protein XdhC n=1 Tax=Thalassospira indica TaxID=1891279 RepID=A0ABN5ND31_9PROT|nr:xanthine dehydrogenase accessory protein XdhC [Thalassospira indica]AXO13364.1 xanthine dehydrogenase accessory protein XdhC [Thalassospira indica]OAZ14758.1 xanthine dehydrogenase [Thalassospira profundimaris]
MTLSRRDHIRLLSQPGPVMLVSVAAIRGSTPREVGAFMLITPDAISGTIGGGNLEHQVTRRVRDGFAQGVDTVTLGEIVRFPLGPGLGQCCGGSVEVGFHLLDDVAKETLRSVLTEIETAPTRADGHWVTVPTDCNDIARVSGTHARMLSETLGAARGGIVTLNGLETLCLRLDDARTPMWIFGAGHVGKAVVEALAPLPFDIHLIDSRDEFLAGIEGENVQVCQSDKPEAEVADIPAGAHVLILTHNHALDFDICRAALVRGDLGFVGMIGSQTKRARFVRRLSDRGLSAVEIGRLTSPIGIQGISGKQPAVIAASVAAQVLSVREAQMANTQTPKSASDGLGNA